MKTVFVVNGVVVGSGWVPDRSMNASVSSVDPDATEYVVDDSNPVGVGWTCLVTNGVPAFTAPTTQTYALLTPMQFYLAFKTNERMLLKALTAGIPANSALNSTPNPIPVDPIISEFWATISDGGRRKGERGPEPSIDSGGAGIPRQPDIADAPGYYR